MEEKQRLLKEACAALKCTEKDVLKKNPDYKWLILGDGEDKEKLENKIKEYNLEDKLILKGKVSNVEDYYKNSALYVMTSRFEGLPMTLLEAKNFKLPIVSFDCQTEIGRASCRERV